MSIVLGPCFLFYVFALLGSSTLLRVGILYAGKEPNEFSSGVPGRWIAGEPPPDPKSPLRPSQACWTNILSQTDSDSLAVRVFLSFCCIAARGF